MDIKIVYSNRRTISLTVNRMGEVILRAPKRISQSSLQKFVQRHQDWILKRHAEAKLKQKKFVEGELFWYLGKQYPLLILEAPKRRLLFENAQFFISRQQLHKARNLFLDWYKNQALEVLPDRVNHYASAMGLSPKKVSIRKAETRWGSCSRAGNINFSSRLVMAPREIIDSVVVHELAHLAHHNHSKSFYQLVEKFYPNYKAAKKWLNKFGRQLNI